MQTFSDIIRSLGGYAVLASELGCPAGTVSAWKTRNIIPAEYWRAVVDFAVRRGQPDITLELLASLAAARLSARAA